MAEPFVGEIRLFSFGIIPQGWAPCNGQIMQINTNQALYSIIGNRFGGDGRTTFALPDLRGRVPVDMAVDYAIGASGGEAQHVLTVNEIPQHTHQAYGDSSGVTSANPEGNVWGTAAAGRNLYSTATANTVMNTNAIGTAGASQGHNNMQPYTAVSFCIALVGIFPSRS